MITPHILNESKILNVGAGNSSNLNLNQQKECPKKCTMRDIKILLTSIFRRK